MSNIDWAKQHLNQAFTLADLYRRGVDDGNLARFLWKRAEILERETPFGGPVAQQWTQEAIETKDKAEQMRMNIERANGLKTPFTKEGKITEEITEETYNDLVCGYFR